MEHIGTGFAGIDEALGGLISGDNVACVCDSAALEAIPTTSTCSGCV